MKSFFRVLTMTVTVVVGLMSQTLHADDSLWSKHSFKSQGHAQPGSHRFGLGIVLGLPTAITGKYLVSNQNAIDVGISFSENAYLLFYGDYLWHFPGYFGHSSEFVAQNTPYIGVGGGIYNWSRSYSRPYGWNGYNSTVAIYTRVPFGSEWYPAHPPLGVFVEVAPGISILPGLEITFDIGIGVRYYF